MNVKKKTTVELLNESEKASLYSISFEMDGTTEFEKFVAEFEMNATYNPAHHSCTSGYLAHRCP